MYKTLLLEAVSQGAQSDWSVWLFPVLLFAGMYFLIIAPQRKKQKQHQKMLAALQSGDEIITIGGVYGTITNIKDRSYVIKIADNTKVEFLKSAVAEKVQVAVKQ